MTALPTDDEHQAKLEELIASNRDVVERLEREQYWRTRERKRVTAWRWFAATFAVVALLLIGGVGWVAYQGRDQADAIRQTQLNGTPLGQRLLAGQIVLLCAAEPIVTGTQATSQAEQQTQLRDCIVRNGVDISSLIQPKETP